MPYHWFYNNFLPLKMCLFSIDFYFVNILILWTLAVKWCMATGAKPHICGVINVCLNSCWWFMLCMVYIPYPVLTLVPRDRNSLCQLGPTVGFYPRMETESSLRNVVFNKKYVLFCRVTVLLFVTAFILRAIHSSSWSVSLNDRGWWV
jgi:hypothetical protein